MKLKTFFIFWILQSIQGTNDSEELLQLDKVKKDQPTLLIAGGTDAPKGLAPYQCSMQDAVQHYCGCGVINENFILTAAHCLNRATPAQIKIMVGSNNNKKGTFYEAERFIIHEHYNEPTASANDIGLVEVKGPILFTGYVQPIALSQKEVPDGARVLLTGWGRKETDGYVARHMQYVRLNIIGMDKCNSSSVSESITKRLREGNICTDNGVGFGACQADSGGCLTYNNKLVGIVSYGIPCGKGHPDVYTSVAYYIDWIRHHIYNEITSDYVYRFSMELEAKYKSKKL